MPRPVRAFSCEFGCRRNVTTKRLDMVGHEATCSLNPATRTCRTCANCSEDFEELDEGGRGLMRGCILGILPDSYDPPPTAVMEAVAFGGKADSWKTVNGEIRWAKGNSLAMMRGCEKWEGAG